MSRYIKLEDAEKAAGGASMFDGRVFVEDVLARLADIPTIEVSNGNLEDAILLTEDAYSDLCLRAAQVSEDNEPTWEQVKEYCRRRGWMLMTVKEVSEIELRAYCQGSDHGTRKTYDELKMEIAEAIRDGEWLRKDGRVWSECSACGAGSSFETKFCGNCGARMKGAR